jgi:hypothetical protein
MNKEFVPYEESLALKELGFDEPCLAHWYNETPTNSEGQCLVYYKKPWDNQNIILHQPTPKHLDFLERSITLIYTHKSLQIILGMLVGQIGKVLYLKPTKKQNLLV